MPKQSEKTEKVKQHYVPKLYLKKFSIQQKEKTISVFRLEQQHYIPEASIESQAMQKYFYGEDGIIEDVLEKLETMLAPAIKSCIDSKTAPKFRSELYGELSHFTLLTDLRNPTRVGQFSTIHKQTKANLIEEYRQTHFKDQIEKMEFPDPNFAGEGLRFLNRARLYCSDLHLKLLVNQTDIPFITSDYPVIMHNSFLEGRGFSSYGYGSHGIQIILPISPSISLILFDPDIYHIGKKNENSVFTSKADVRQLNEMQYCNAYSSVFGNECVSESYLRELFESTKTYKNKKVIVKQLGDIKGFQIEGAYRMNLSFIHLTNIAKICEILPGFTYLRPHIHYINHLENKGYFKNKVSLD